MPSDLLRAGRVGRPHGLDGSFYVAEANALLLDVGIEVLVDGEPARIVRRAGDDRRPIIRLDGCEDRDGAQALHGQQLMVARGDAPELESDEWWAEDLEGCAVFAGEREVGVVKQLVALPSVEVLEVERASGEGELLVPLVADAVLSVDTVAKRIDVDLAFLGEA